MASAYDKLARILHLEYEQGCRDRAVIGGLDRFLAYWEREAQEESAQIEHSLPVDDIVRALADYGGMAAPERQAVIRRMLDALLADVAQPLAPNAMQSAEETPTAEKDRSSSPEEVCPLPEAQRATRAEASQRLAAPGQGASRARRAVRRRAPAGGEVTLSSPITALRGVSTVTEKRLARLGLNSIRDLLYHLPRRYDDFTQLKVINRLTLGEDVSIAGIVSEVRTYRSRGGTVVTRCVLRDGSGAIEVSWFNQPFLEKQLPVGVEVVISGRVDEFLGRLTFTSPEWEPLERKLLHTGRLVPIYGLTEGIRMRWLRRLIRGVLDDWVPRITDPLPADMLKATSLTGLGRALEQIHFPDDAEQLEQARRRLCFDEFFLLQLGILRYRQERQSQTSWALEMPEGALERFSEGLPFELTGAQQRAIDAILGDLAKPAPMNRLLQGDVGSGKTVVAAAAILAAVRNGLQAAIMAPTSILAEQHYQTISSMLAGEPDIRSTLLVGSLPAAEKRRAQEEVASGEAQVAVGTHALIQKDVEFARLGLVVVDEQHRFGVSQRGALRAKAIDRQPHLLAMSATPIPRTLALTVYGDLDVSVLDEMPPNRQEIITAVRDHRSRERIYSFISAQVREGRQAFVICPLVEESDELDAKAAVSEHRRLQEDIFPDLRVGLLHGRVSADEKEQIMADFKAGAYHILVSTAVVEVGIDVPNATVMLIEGAERFGLATLHQFRGRVGRGEHASYCILLASDASPDGLARLRIMEETNDGFVLAEKDLEMRGPGDFFGVRQHGLPLLKIAKLSDTAILEEARAQAMQLYERDPELSQPEHQIVAASVRHFWAQQELS